jgi:hypothetical protein
MDAVHSLRASTITGILFTGLGFGLQIASGDSSRASTIIGNIFSLDSDLDSESTLSIGWEHLLSSQYHFTGLGFGLRIDPVD